MQDLQRQDFDNIVTSLTRALEYLQNCRSTPPEQSVWYQAEQAGGALDYVAWAIREYVSIALEDASGEELTFCFNLLAVEETFRGLFLKVQRLGIPGRVLATQTEYHPREDYIKGPLVQAMEAACLRLITILKLAGKPYEYKRVYGEARRLTETESPE